jgi:hypothetical protein
MGARAAIISGLALAFATVSGPARADFVSDYRTYLGKGQTEAAAAHAEARLSEMPEDAQAQFALGSAQFLLAVEHLAQGLHRYGLRPEYDASFGGLSGLPFLRLPVPPNPEPEQVTYEGLRAVLYRFVEDLSIAEATLAGIPDVPVDLPLDLALIRLDLNGDGTGSEDERLLTLFAAVSGGGGAGLGTLAVDFDESDVPWLQAYCHLLMAMAEFPLAHDWEAAFDTTFHNLFPASELPSSEIAAEVTRLRKQLEGQRPRRPSAPAKPKDMSYPDWWQSPEYQAYLDSPEYRRYEEFRQTEQAMEIGAIADLIAFVHLFNWPVVEPDRMANVRTHFLSMVALSRESWRRIALETDNRNEWIPKPVDQTGVFPRIRVTPERVKGWHLFLDEFEAVLTGERLIPHWRFFGRGVNVRRMFEEPRTFDPVLIGQGSAVLPYLEEGEMVTGDTVEEVARLMGRGFFAYFIWFN